MTEYAAEYVVQTTDLDPTQFATFPFGPPTPGLMRFIVHPMRLAGPGALWPPAEPTRPRTRVMFAPGPGAGEPTDEAPIPASDFHVEIIDSTGVVSASGDALATFVVPEPTSTPFSPKWQVRVTNNGQTRASISVNGVFFGHRPILSRTIDLEFINEKLNLLLSAPENAITIAFENVTTSHAPWWWETDAYDLQRTFLRIVGTGAFADLNVEVDVGARIFTRAMRSSPLEFRATIHDGALAIRIRVAFETLGVDIDIYSVVRAITSGMIDTLADVAQEFDEWTYSVDRFGLDLFVVLRPGGRFGEPTFELAVTPRVSLSSDWITNAAIAFLQLAFEKLIPDAAQSIFRAKAFDALGWIMGERGRAVVGSEEDLALTYIGDAPPTRGDPHLHFPWVTGPLPDPANNNLSKVDHIVVLMMENRSFDHMLGFMSLPRAGNQGRIGLGRADVDGLRGDETNPMDTRGNRGRVFPLSAPRPGTQVRPEVETRGTRFPHDPGHSFHHTKRQRGGYDIVEQSPWHELIREGRIDAEAVEPEDLRPRIFHVGPNEGFIFDFAQKALAGAVSALEEQILKGDVMGYHPAEHVPVYRFLAEEYAICDRWFAAHPGHTWPNRFVTLTGGLAPGPDGLPQVDNPDIGTYDPLEVPTIFDYLTQAGVEWRYYEHDLSMLRLFSKYTFDRERIISVDDADRGFFAAARRGDLPPVTFIEPDLTDVPPGNDDHPPGDIQDGQALVKRLYDALVQGPAWDRTLFIITYDEHGGFYDHVHPEARQLLNPFSPEAGGFASLADDPGTGLPVDYYGMRVPAFVISPWVPRSHVSKTEYDHTTIAKTIIARFLWQHPPDMGFRVALAADLGPLLSLPAPRQAIDSPPVVFQPDRRWVLSRLVSLPEDDFHAFMGAFRRRMRAE